MRLSIRHTTHYEFTQPVAHGLQRLRLMPKSTHGQRVLDWEMQLDGLSEQTRYEDHHHNATALVSVLPGASAVTITCSGTVETVDNSGILGSHTGHMPLWAFLMQTDLTRPGPKMRALAAGLTAKPGDNGLERLHELANAVLEPVAYEIGRTGANTTAEEALAAGHGVCQDHAHIFIGAARLLGFPARYVSGYLMMNDRIDQEAGHGWAEAHVDDLGWVGFDVSNGISPDPRYVRVASGRDYRDAAPVTGISYGAGESTLVVSLAVEQQPVQQ
jgi:transglutaminase-like putative cysteine protease